MFVLFIFVWPLPFVIIISLFIPGDDIIASLFLYVMIRGNPFKFHTLNGMNECAAVESKTRI